MFVSFLKLFVWHKEPPQNLDDQLVQIQMGLLSKDSENLEQKHLQDCKMDNEFNAKLPHMQPEVCSGWDN